MKKRFLFAQLLLGFVGTGLAMGESELTESLIAPPACVCQQPCTTPQPCAEVKDECKSDEACGEEKKCRWCHDGALGDPWTLPQPCLLKEAGINVSGWAQSGILTNSHGAGTNGPLGFNNLTDFNLHQLWIYGEKKTDTEKNDIDWGGRVDYVYGVDGPDTQAFGDQSWDYGWSSGSGRYGSALPQAYVDLAFGDWTIRGGRFYTSIGYEVVPATGNFFFSHAYAMYYAEPFTHTGFLVTRKLNDKLTVSGGWVDGWDSGFDNNNKESTFLGGATLTLSEDATLAWMVSAGNWGNGAVSTSGDIYMNSIVFNYKVTEKWTYILQHDLGINSNLPGGGETQWYGINQYLLRKINDCLSAGARFEWFRDDDGVRVVAGNDGNYYEATLGVNYKPHANLLFRPEVRWDWYDGAVAGNNHPFNDGQSDSQFSAGFDMIFTF